MCKILGSQRAVTAPPNVISSFAQGGIVSFWSKEHNCLIASVDRNKVRKTRCELGPYDQHSKRINID